MGFGTWIRGWVAAVADVVWPRRCAVCGTPLVPGEEVMCLQCRVSLPVTNYHRSPLDNALCERIIDVAVPIERAAAMFFYSRQGAHSNLIRSAKYRGQPHINRTLAREYATQIAAEGFFDGIDMLVPVPLHPSRMRARGYNQSMEICRGISEVTGIAVNDCLGARRHSKQARLGRLGRLLNAERTFYVADANGLDGHHLLLVDDVITTGATVKACAKAIHTAAPGAVTSVLALSVTAG